MRKNQIPQVLLLFILCFSQYQITAQQVESEGRVRVTDGTPTIELYDNAASEQRVEGLIRENGDNIFIDATQGDLRLGSSETGSPITRMTLTGDNGYLGLGTTDPDERIHLQTDDTDWTFDGVTMEWDNTNSGSFRFYNSLSITGMENSQEAVANFPKFFMRNNTLDGMKYQMVIDSDGDVGIGEDIPLNNVPSAVYLEHKIAESTSIHNDGVRIQNNGANQQYWSMYIRNSDGFLQLHSKHGGNAILGTFDDEDGDYSSMSDGRMKSNIEIIPPVLGKVAKLNPVSYYFNHKTDRTEKNMGLIAQELDKLFPEFVHYSKEADQYSVNYAGLSTIALKAIQEQQKQIDELKEIILSIQVALEK